MVRKNALFPKNSDGKYRKRRRLRGRGEKESGTVMKPCAHQSVVGGVGSGSVAGVTDGCRTADGVWEPPPWWPPLGDAMPGVVGAARLSVTRMEPPDEQFESSES